MYNGSIRRIRINGTPNRMGLIFLVLKAISDYGINIVTMESDPYICCKLEWNDSISEDDFLNFMRTRVPEIESISYIDLMEYERIEIELSTLLNNVDCAIIKCDIEGNVLTFNEKDASSFIPITHILAVANLTIINYKIIYVLCICNPF